MKRLRLPLLLLLGLLGFGCLSSGCQPAPVLRRTPVPTWTLPFAATQSPPAALTPTPASATLGAAPAAATPTRTPVDTATDIVLTSTPSPTARPGIDPTRGAATPDPYSVSYLPIPSPVPQRHLDENVFNILLTGSDTALSSGSYRTDVMIVVSINKATNSATLLTIPRDLYVYIPGWKVTRINTAAAHGDQIGHPGGGMALLQQTILYNLGLPIHGWARIDFDGFRQVVDILGGVDVPVSCAMSDWHLKDPSLDDQNADNWEMYTVEPGVQHMDGYLALWYARSRKHSSDYDRSRRQHQVLRAMLTKALQLDILPKIPELYATYGKIVQTDLVLGDILQFVPLASQISQTRIKSRFIGRSEVYSWTAPDGAMVLLPDTEAIARLLDEAFQPPAANMLAREAAKVEIWNGTSQADWTALAADNLAWSGFQPVIGQADAADYTTTRLHDYTTSPKGSPVGQLQNLFHLGAENVLAEPDPAAPYPFRVVLGADYNSCVTVSYAVRPTPTPIVTAAPLTTLSRAAPIIGAPPPIDGDLTEWTQLPYTIQEPSWGAASRRDLADLSATWQAAWDDLYLYLAIRVKDDVFVPAAAGNTLYKGDSLEIWLDTDPGNRTTTLSSRDYQLGLSPGNLASPPAQAAAYLWYPQDQARAITDARVEGRLTADGYDLELAIPWAAFGFQPFAGEGFAFTLALNDNDTPGAQEQQSQVVTLRNAKLTDPTTWGLLVLEPPP